MPAPLSGEPKWLMPETITPDPPGVMRFFLQPRWAPGSYEMDGPVRRRNLRDFTELEIEMRFANGSVVGVIYLKEHPDSGVLVQTCFGEFFQQLRTMLYGPGDERSRQRLWQRLPEVRPMFMAANRNGLLLDYNELALVHQPDPSDGISKNMIVSLDRTCTIGSELPMQLLGRCAGVLTLSQQLFEEALVPLDLESLYRGGDMPGMLASAGAAAEWLLHNAGDLGDLLNLVNQLA